MHYNKQIVEKVKYDNGIEVTYLHDAGEVSEKEVKEVFENSNPFNALFGILAIDESETADEFAKFMEDNRKDKMSRLIKGSTDKWIKRHNDNHRTIYYIDGTVMRVDYKCKSCNKWLEMNSDNFHMSYNNSNNLRHECKCCQNKRSKDNYRANRSKFMKIKAERMKARSEDKKRNGFTDKIFELMKLQNNYTCCYCGKHSNHLERDRVVPALKGGTYALNNVVVACGSCNRSKGAKTLDDWYKKQPFYSENRYKKIVSRLNSDPQTIREKLSQLDNRNNKLFSHISK